ncbi:hypothetical protein MTR67_044137 [Solanum verrucosum]|uniref:Uncharacterized protein n=1 Tax=Solanum verrucosum TaxID=315347 RepID=A0AAF0UQP6_SOLVR|nr:hypothetical protein MTR67_044137 [Solanum verrucosum]
MSARMRVHLGTNNGSRLPVTSRV